MTSGGVLIAAALLGLLALLVACLSAPMRARMTELLPLAPIPALLAAILSKCDASLALPPALLGATFVIDKPGAMLLGTAALLWIAAGIYAATFMRADTDRGAFAVWWLLALVGNLGVFMVADLASFYLFFAVGGLSAYGLIAHDGTSTSRRAGIMYIAFALLGEALLLMALVLLSATAPERTILIRDAVAVLSQSPSRDIILALVIAGLGLKIALVPLHVWMPLAYTAAPIPAAAVLSGAAVKAGVIGFLRFLPFDAASPEWGSVLAGFGIISAFYGVAVGITQSNPKTVLAYSSISQMGLIAAVLGMGLASGDGTTASAVSFYAAHHVLVKGGLFLAVGIGLSSGSRPTWAVLVPATVLALSLAGLPFTGGWLAKLAVKPTLGAGWIGTFAALAAAGSTLLMLHFLRCVTALPRTAQPVPAPAGLLLPWLAVALASVVVPWALYPTAVQDGYANALSLAGLWDGVWPVLLGGALAWLLRARRVLMRELPVGDIVVAYEAGARAMMTRGAILSNADQVLRGWRVASAGLLAVVAVLAATLVY
ncbi:complex I subunit 5 family protein [Hyphomicrobium sp.]|uniref:complex I subunit 5 family protein n=1 Tax=Hyphomicrobium sp. TaxID=82 RepID=UPI002E34494E|nr:proton-conducting transporter membrane subunit [Hyphomicrobium sp.]HEX2840486.1 proton-conducting transporter membrane subunit [Hyphomicrobium sp.]